MNNRRVLQLIPFHDNKEDFSQMIECIKNEGLTKIDLMKGFI